MTRMTMPSSQRTKPVTRPMASPIDVARMATDKPTASETRRADSDTAVDVASQHVGAEPVAPPTVCADGAPVRSPVGRRCRERAPTRHHDQQHEHDGADDGGRVAAHGLLDTQPGRRPASPRQLGGTVGDRGHQYWIRGSKQPVGQVDCQIDQDIDGREQQDHALDNRVVAADDGIHGETADAGNGKHALRDNHAGDQQRDANADYCHNRHCRVLQSMPQQHRTGCQSFGVRGAHVILSTGHRAWWRA